MHLFRLIRVLFGGLVSIFSFIRRKSGNSKTKKLGNSIVERVGVDLNFKQDLINDLIFLAGSKKYTDESPAFLTEFSFLKTESFDKNIQVKYVEFMGNSCLVILQYAATDIDYSGVNLQLKEVTDINQFNFIVRKNESKKTYELYSDLYIDLSDKLLRIQVANKILERVQ